MAQQESDWQAALENALRDALDRMAMMDVSLDADACVPAYDAKSMAIEMPLHGDTPTSIELRLPRALAATWSAAIAGVETAEIDSSEIEDGGRELLNMIAGAAKTSLSEHGIEFDLGIPEVGPCAAAREPATDSGETIRLGARSGDHPIEVIVRVG